VPPNALAVALNVTLVNEGNARGGRGGVIWGYAAQPWSAGAGSRWFPDMEGLAGLIRQGLVADLYGGPDSRLPVGGGPETLTQGTAGHGPRPVAGVDAGRMAARQARCRWQRAAETAGQRSQVHSRTVYAERCREEAASGQRVCERPRRPHGRGHS